MGGLYFRNMISIRSEGFQDELVEIQEYVLGNQDMQDLVYLENLLERVTDLVVREVAL